MHDNEIERNADGTWPPFPTVYKADPATRLRIFRHDSEVIDGVLFVRTSEYEQDWRLRERTLIRADLVRG
jgi:hypothetical protein